MAEIYCKNSFNNSSGSKLQLRVTVIEKILTITNYFITFSEWISYIKNCNNLKLKSFDNIKLFKSLSKFIHHFPELESKVEFLF